MGDTDHTAWEGERGLFKARLVLAFGALVYVAAEMTTWADEKSGGLVRGLISFFRLFFSPMPIIPRWSPIMLNIAALTAIVVMIAAVITLSPLLVRFLYRNRGFLWTFRLFMLSYWGLLMFAFYKVSGLEVPIRLMLDLTAAVITTIGLFMIGGKMRRLGKRPSIAPGSNAPSIDSY
jgi:hypothetical protein